MAAQKRSKSARDKYKLFKGKSSGSDRKYLEYEEDKKNKLISS